MVRLFLTFSFIITCLYSPLWAGNKEIVEKRVREIEELNERIIEQVPEVPEDGSITLEAKVLNKEWTVDYNVLQQGTETTTTKSGTIVFSDDEQKS